MRRERPDSPLAWFRNLLEYERHCLPACATATVWVQCAGWWCFGSLVSVSNAVERFGDVCYCLDTWVRLRQLQRTLEHA